MANGRLSVQALTAWADVNGVKLDGVEIEERAIGASSDPGYAIVAQQDLVEEETGPLITVPDHLVLSSERVLSEAQHHADLKELLDAASGLAETSRGAILLYLVWLQSTTACGVAEKTDITAAWADYVKLLSPCALPSRWTKALRELLKGTSLETALAAKVDRLDREFEHLRSTTSTVAWCDRLWWQPGSRRMSEDKWSSVDAWYRSRSLSFVWAGDAMVPCIDMANHAGDGSRNAYFDRDVAGRALLRLAPRQRLKRGDEVTISYGDTKSAAEMLFSYGFIEPDTTRTGAVTLDLPVPDDDPLKQAKEAASSTVAAVRISWAADVSSTLWETSSVWLICVNEEDGLRFSVVPGADGEPVLTVAWQGHDLTHDLRDLEALLRRDDRWPLYELRAIVTVLERVQLQLRRLDVSAPEVADANATIDEGEGQAASAARAAALRLRELEQDLLEQSRRDLEQQLLERSHVNIADMAAPPRDE